MTLSRLQCIGQCMVIWSSPFSRWYGDTLSNRAAKMQESILIMSDIHREGMTARFDCLGTTRHFDGRLGKEESKARDGTMRKINTLKLLEASINKAEVNSFERETKKYTSNTTSESTNRPSCGIHPPISCQYYPRHSPQRLAWALASTQAQLPSYFSPLLVTIQLLIARYLTLYP
jgi:hypothetical protein